MFSKDKVGTVSDNLNLTKGQKTLSVEPAYFQREALVTHSETLQKLCDGQTL